MDKPTICGDTHDASAVQSILKDALVSSDTALDAAEIFSALGDSTRIRLIGILAKAEMCVGDLTIILGISQPAISQHLRILRNLKILAARKEGRHVYYSLADEHIEEIFKMGIAHAEHK